MGSVVLGLRSPNLLPFKKKKKKKKKRLTPITALDSDALNRAQTDWSKTLRLSLHFRHFNQSASIWACVCLSASLWKSESGSHTCRQTRSLHMLRDGRADWACAVTATLLLFTRHSATGRHTEELAERRRVVSGARERDQVVSVLSGSSDRKQEYNRLHRCCSCWF